MYVVIERLCTDLQNFREALAILQQQVDDLDQLKATHYQEIIEHEEQVWEVVQGKVGVRQYVSVAISNYLQVCVVVRSTMDVFDRFTTKSCVVPL